MGSRCGGAVITAHAGELQVDPENYALMGFSSGGQLCALFGTDRMGYQNYGLPKPGALLLAYPILNYAYGKPVLFYLYDRAQPGDHLAPGDYYYNVEVPAEVTADFPATFQWYGKNDSSLRGFFTQWQSPALDEALARCGVPHALIVYDEAPHGSANGAGTDAARLDRPGRRLLGGRHGLRKAERTIEGTDTMNAKKMIAAALAAAMLAAAALPAGALPAPYLTPDTTVAQMRANEGIAGSGFDTWDRGSLFPEQPWQYGDWTLRRYIGQTVDDAVAG